jgi:sarcosine oxidase
VTSPACDVAVVGLGALGSATARAAARRGATVIGFEQFELGHDRGASQDHSRIIRRSYHTPGYVRLADQAYRAWAELEAETGTTVVRTTGGLDLFPAGAAIEVGEYTAAMDAEAVPYEVLTGDEVRARWPVWQGLDPDLTALFQGDTGIVAASTAVAALQQAARGHGAVLRERTPVLEVGDGWVRTAEDRIEAGRVVVATDAWTNRLLEPLGAGLPLTVLREQVTWFEVDDAPGFATPTWIWMDDPSYYGFPSTDGETIKAAQDCGGAEVDPDTRTFEPDRDGEARLAAFLAARFGDRVGAVRASKTCLYTLTPDRDFVLDRVSPRVWVALGAAHGFKFAAWFGRALADLALDGGTEGDLAPFRLARPGLAAGATPAWLV